MEYTQYSDKCTQKPSSIVSWTEIAKEHDIEEERFEIYSQESRTEFKSS